MRLKALELYGYKSFASRCEFAFSQGITAIVGPNGSGKSNVADAVRWVLGEQSFRSLRARTTEDMIFAGSRRRARLGMAEAVLTLDNSDGWLPLDFQQVTVGRRAHRSGENEYLINGSRVRYRDVLDLFGSAGLARSTYTVIGQGMVDAALALRPEARRALFEEAAGIAPHLRKRTDALRRIQETERNLVRVSDILAELHPRVRRLRRQAERADEYLLLEQDLLALQRIWFGHQWQASQESLASTHQRVSDTAQSLDKARTAQDEGETRRQALSVRIAAQEERVRTLEAALSDIRRHREQRENALQIARERESALRRQRGILVSDLDALASRRTVLLQGIAQATEELTAQQAELASAQANLSAIRSEVDALKARRQTSADAVRRLERESRQTIGEIDKRQARAEALAQQKLDAQHSLGEAQALADEVALRKKEIAKQLKRSTIALEAKTADQQAAAVRVQEIDKAMAIVHESIQAAKEEVARLRTERAQLLARRDSLARMRQEMSGYYPGVRHILSQQASRKGILGTVAQLMTVPGKYEQAIESALGGRLQNIVTESWDDAEWAISELKRDRSGWATFLPLDTLHARSKMQQPRGQGIIGIASDIVRHEARLRDVFELLLGRVLVVENLSAARRLLRDRTGASLLVTLAGETVQPSGAVSGGTRRRNSQLLAQERAWRELPHEIERVEQTLETAHTTLDEAASQRDAATAERQRLADEATMLERVCTELRNRATAAEQDEQQAERESIWLQERATQAQSQTRQVEERESTLQTELTTLTMKRQSVSADLASQREALDALDDEAPRSRLAHLETQTAVARRTVESQQRLLGSHQANLDENSEQVQLKEAQIASLDAVEGEQSLAIESAKSEISAIQAQLDDAQAQIPPARETGQTLRRELLQAEKSLGAARARAQQTDSAHSRAEMERQHEIERRERLVRDIEGALGPVALTDSYSQQLRLGLAEDAVELPQVTALPQGLEQELGRLRRRIRRLGNVNADAPEEYRQLLDRQTFLQTQVSDLRGAIATLNQVIGELDEIIERDFGATVRRVDIAFRRYFRTLFEGGSARLELTNPDDLGDTGVEIIAHPPGKRSQSLALLSGGERALTAVALLFALLKAHPVPFCFLDEVDAALDEVNVARFRDLLGEHAITTQFVIITHNRRTIEAADTIYGISMGEQGVSESISLKLDEMTRELQSQRLKEG